MSRYSDCLRLNLRVAKLALANQWIDARHVANSYDALANGYEQNWLSHLRPVSDEFLERIPTVGKGRILDLGCGTGHTTRHLAKKNPDATIIAQDISEGMLELARSHAGCGRSVFHAGDMLEFLKAQPADSARLVVSAWAIGYSHPSKVLKESSRALETGGRFAFVVNLMDTLRPVHVAFRKTMQRHPEKLRSLSWPRFPSAWEGLEKKARDCGFATEWIREGRLAIRHSTDASLAWLLDTGILAGFDAMLPLRDDPEVAAYFERCLREQNEPLKHHYIMAVLQKHE